MEHILKIIKRECAKVGHHPDMGDVRQVLENFGVDTTFDIMRILLNGRGWKPGQVLIEHPNS